MKVLTKESGMVIALLTYILEVVDSSPCRDTCYPKAFSQIFSVPPSKHLYLLLLDHERFLTDPFQIVIHLSSLHWTLRSLAPESVVK
jgi:hypothetical protein